MFSTLVYRASPNDEETRSMYLQLYCEWSTDNNQQMNNHDVVISYTIPLFSQAIFMSLILLFMHTNFYNMNYLLHSFCKGAKDSAKFVKKTLHIDSQFESRIKFFIHFFHFRIDSHFTLIRLSWGEHPLSL